VATITTASITDVVAYPNTPAFARDHSNGRLYALVQTATGTLTLLRSTDAGGSWSNAWGPGATSVGFTHTNLAEWSSLVVDKNGWAHIAYRVSTTGGGGTDTIWYRRCDLVNAAWDGGMQTSSSDSNGGTAGATWQGVDLAVVRHSIGTYAIAVCGARTQGTTRYGVQVMGVSIGEGNVVYLNNGIVINNREFWTTGTAPGRSGISCELEHNGDGFTSSTPHLWITWGRTVLYNVKLAWQGTYVGWQGPSDGIAIRSGLSAHDSISGRWDGTRWMSAVISPDNTSQVRVFQRNQANTSTTYVDSPTHTTGVIRQIALSYDSVTRNIRVYAVGTSTTVLYFVDYNRGAGTWGSWATVTATAVLGTGGVEFSVKRGGNSYTAKHDVVTAHSGAPNTIVHTAQTTASAPSIATWDTSTVPYFNGGAADTAATLTLDWNFTDQDPGDTQGSYALSRQIGAAAVQYYTAAGGTWGGTEVQNSTATTSVTLAASWGAGTDADHVYKVKVWDASNTPAPGYSAALKLIASVKVNPAIVTPTAAQVINTDQVTMTWTAAEQKTRRIRLTTNPGSQVVYDSGYIADTGLSFTVPVKLANGSGWTIELTTTNLEGLASTAQTRNFTVSYASPPASISTVTAVPASGWMAVTASALAAVGAQPAIVSQDLYRRVKTNAILTSNPSMAGNVTGWTGVGTTTMAYSTVQFHDSPGAALATPTGAAALSLVRHTALIDVVAGAKYYASGWIRPTTGNKNVLIQLDWYTSGSVFISSTTITVTPVATAWMFLEVMGDPSTVATAAKVTMSIGESGTPAAGDTFYADELELTVYNADTGIRIAAGAGAGATYNDWGAASSVDYEYRWITTGANGTTIQSPWTG
jgi:hypothetical protein